MNRPVGPDDGVVTCFRDGTVTLRKNRRELGFTESLKEIGYQGVRCGDLVIHAMDAFAGACGVSDSDGKSTPVYSVCAPKDGKANSQYYAFCVREMARSRWIVALSRGVRERSTDFRFATFGDQLVPVPPSLEQAAIVRFLDHADRRIRRYIRAKERLIKLLEEQKQAIIHQAVTGQIDVRTGQPYPAYKDSGVEWLGEVPEHWEVRRMKTLSQIRYGLGQPPREAVDGLPLIRATNVSRGQIVEENMVHVDPSDVPAGRNALLSAGEIIVVRSGAYTADSAIIPKEYSGAVTGYDMVVTAAGALPEFVAFALLAAYVRVDQLVVASLRAAQPHLNAEELGNALVLVPRLHEQGAIAEYLDKTTSDIAAAIARAHRLIALLGEYRTRLIAKVVTGKLDVREAAAALPEHRSSRYRRHPARR